MRDIRRIAASLSARLFVRLEPDVDRSSAMRTASAVKRMAGCAARPRCLHRRYRTGICASDLVSGAPSPRPCRPRR